MEQSWPELREKAHGSHVFWGLSILAEEHRCVDS